MTRTTTVLRIIAFFIIVTVQWPAIAADGPGKPPPVNIAVFNFELIDMSLEGAGQAAETAETKRLVLISNFLRDLLDKSGQYKIVDLAPAAASIAEAEPIHGCNGCEIAIAHSLHADHVMTGTVLKISTLILGIEISEREVSTGRVLHFANAQIRGNTDQSWKRGVKWLVRNRLLAGR